MKNVIKIKGAREHNLKNIDLEIPRDKIVVFTGLSGSGKSSLAFDTIFAEGQRRYIESLSAYARQFLGKLTKPDIDEIEGLSPAISIDQKSHSANPRSTVATLTEIYDYLRVLFARAGTPHCPECGHLIRKMTNEEIVDAVIELAKTNSEQGNMLILAPVVRGRKGEYYQLLYDFLNSGFSEARIDGTLRSLRNRVELDRYKQHTIDLIVDRIPGTLDFSDNDNRLRLSEAIETALRYGHNVLSVVTDKEVSLSAEFTCPNDGFSFPEIEPRLFSFNSPHGACEACHGLGTEDVWSEQICTVCAGKRLRLESLSILIEGANISSIVQRSIEDAHAFFLVLLKSSDQRFLDVAEAPLREILSRLKFMLDVGLEYLTLDRKAGTLSGGEAQRIRLASQIGSRLVGTLYVLDEPTIGLHQRDNEKLVKTLHELRDLGNTVLVVEHDVDTVLASDYLVDIGPGAGTHGGNITAQGAMPALLKDKKQDSLTLKYLRGDEKIPVPDDRRKVKFLKKQMIHESLKVKGATANNLKNVDVQFPLRRFTAVTGVSGSGKSTLVYDVLYKYLANRFNAANHKPGVAKSILGLEYLDRIINIDQSAIGRTPRSNPATYVGAWTYIRELFAATPDAKVRGYKPGRFSFNVSSGRCEHCEGHGTIAIEMHFLPTVYVECDVCKGKRFDRETLEVRYGPSSAKTADGQGKNIHQVLQMTIEEAAAFFDDIPWLHDRLNILEQVGLGYLRLGQSATTLSGGEAQRIKLSKELGKRDTRKTLYLLDEPTTGLHFDDVKKLLEVLQRLVDRGNTVIVIEHNLDVIKSADWVVDLGLEGGERGGAIVATGTPEMIARSAGSHTGRYLKRVL
ncbi:MAG: excinuclease ABC subunit A [Candidatus Harrisonbacteria bacterium CG10_big_fil_rev_8_21_14_0_10_42_17]|uniref:UvrABC system protein A n=1 Tax=Candidatus Harrisonbacteria bacterium CG10_big_fil_rev_8_21_14_0_10_42_17 TaxID=1974584 RepID=A0A2M6WHP3_9BACT|nr:MAG: excinuclease ABC subunit A [Candidatus Harrisonbacteria bacterium CG10_big_fil_rev_8_21_14_0_10_42_17]